MIAIISEDSVTSIFRTEDLKMEATHPFETLVPSYTTLQSEHKVFPWLQTFFTRNLLYVKYKFFLM